MRLKKLGSIVLAATLAVGIFSSVGTTSVEAAKTITVKEKNGYTYYIGSSRNIYGATGLKINGKSMKKMASKVSASVTETNLRGFGYQKAAYVDGYGYYATNNEAYNAQNNTKYLTTNNYSLMFLKTGSYKVTYTKYDTVQYTTTSISGLGASYKTVNGQSGYYGCLGQHLVM